MTYSATVNQSNKRKAAILVIEDNPDQWAIVRNALLECFPEVEPVWMPDSAQALTYLESCLQSQKRLPRLILLDLYLPQSKMGWNLLEIFKSHDLYREIPVVILSYSTNPEDVKESYRCRSNSYIVKPTSYSEWVECFAQFRQYWWDAVTLPRPS